MMDYDNIVIDEIVRRLTENVNGGNRIKLINDIKRKRLDLYQELQKKKKSWDLEEDKKLEQKLISLSKWQDHREDLFS